MSIFSKADILLPKYDKNDSLWNKWAVIACDQFTSEPDYWERVIDNVGKADSALNYIIPEAFLGTDKEANIEALVKNKMDNLNACNFNTYSSSVFYTERILPDGTIRHGLIGKIDLEEYDFNKGSTSAIRATEATVLERIPPRCAVRAKAKIELPHILLLMDDPENRILSETENMKPLMKTVYDFDLMENGGHITAYLPEGELAEKICDMIFEYENSKKLSQNNAVVYAVGDGNHSLAAAKAHWMNLKKAGAAMTHPARYALVELGALADKSLEFEPIYRVVKNCDKNDFISSIKKITGDGNQSFKMITADGEEVLSFSNPTHALTVGSLQDFIDLYAASHPEIICDYIHGENVVRELVSDKNTVGFLFDTIEKAELFPYVEKHGSLPRKTFSMGEARSKRYYIESRMIV